MRLALPSKCSRSVFRRRGGPRGRPEHGSASVQPPQKEGTVSSFAVGAAISRPQAFALLGRRCRAYARRMRVGSGMAEVLQRAGQCPAPTKRRVGFCVRRRGGTLGRPVPNSRQKEQAPLLKSSGARIKSDVEKEEKQRFPKRRNAVSHKVLLPTFLSRKVGQPLRVSAQAAYLATFSSHSDLVAPLARM